MVRLILFILLALLPTAVLAQDSSQDIQPPDLQQFAQMASCMQDIDQTRLQEYQQQSIALAAKLDALCTSGKRKEAEQALLDYHQKLANDPVLKAINACMEKVEGDSFNSEGAEDSGEEGSTHICDEL